MSNNTWFPVWSPRCRNSRHHRQQFSQNLYTFWSKFIIPRLWGMKNPPTLSRFVRKGFHTIYSSTMRNVAGLKSAKETATEDVNRNFIGGTGDDEKGVVVNADNKSNIPSCDHCSEYDHTKEDGDGVNEDECEIYFQNGKLFDSNGDPIGKEDLSGPWLSIPEELGFFKDDNAGVYVAKIKLKNTSPMYISYKVVSTVRNIFTLSHRRGMLPPKQSGEILVTSKCIRGRGFDKILGAAFMVFATPILFDSQTSEKRIEILWKAYGSKFFPFDAAETHVINKMVPEHDKYMDNYCIMLKASLGNYIMSQEKPELKLFLSRRGTELEEREFVKSWMPPEIGSNQTRFVKYQLRFLSESLVNVKSDIRQVVMTSRIVFLIILSFAILLYASKYTNILQGFGANGDWLVTKEVVEEQPKSWWSSFTNLF